MEKLRLNNEIVSMRHSVRKAQVHVIHRLTREINKLKNRKGNEKQVEKCKRKAERLKEELKNIKKLKGDDVSKFAIKNTRELQEILMDLQSTSLERALGRLACHPDVQAHIQKLRSEPVDWVSVLDDLGAQTKMKKKHKKQKAKKTENLGTYEPGRFVRIRRTSSNENLTSDVVISEEVGTSDEEKWEHNSEEPNILPDAALSVKNKTSMKKTKIKINSTNPVTSDVLQYSGRTKSVESDENISSDENKNFSEPSDQESEHLSDEQVIRSSTSENVKMFQPDPFFLTDEGEYLSSIVKSESVNNEEQTMKEFGNSNSASAKYPKKNKNHKGKNTFNDRFQGPLRSTHKNRRMNDGRGSRIDKGRKRFQGEPLKRKPTQNTYMKRENPDVKTNQNDPGVSLHPSWEAKKKMQQQQLNIHAFQGKKIKFDDD